MLEIKNLYTGYDCVDVVHNLSLKAERGKVLTIVGPNGCGKTTLLKAVARLLPYRGTITLEGHELKDFSRKNLAKKIALMGQSSQIYFPYSVYDTVALGRYPYSDGFLKSLSKDDEDIIERILGQLELREVRNRMITELSGGQLQRVFLARTLAQNPDLILLDEPTNHLDLKHQVELLDYLSKWVKENDKTVTAVLHDLNLARRFGDTAALMYDGKLIASGEPETVLNGETLKEIYGIDVKAFMLESLKKWQAGNA
ncbi:ABC transporter ATP-binding protein [Leadbettera azotonutricia]|uniref:Ferrichrome transport ATP-binding protein FhuC n=1 Tax=Leadbettera azotonutricia (strain ATCC BAA-888 / DSM 13862 / ZAS-9) TaxID=545695 RepID=F5Y847_LEAAZ|nr:ABC transporter ATP-binding protein [Leadbettera azotonutricia]AEF81111.1 ferrichrome transport ATP-binding protein FhuC [Leadbettera azotonutricia ZAS-9]